MRRVLDVDILQDGETRDRVVFASLALLVVGVAGALVLALAGGFAPSGWVWWVALAAGYLASLPVHELVHAAFFKLLGPRGTKVRFGCQAGMLYAGCPGTRLARGRFAAVLLAPFVLLNLAYLAVGLATGDALLAWALFALHASGCTGDLYFAYLVLRHPEADLCEDTDRGFALWSSADGPVAGGRGGGEARVCPTPPSRSAGPSRVR